MIRRGKRMNENYLVKLDNGWYMMSGNVLSREESKEQGFEIKEIEEFE